MESSRFYTRILSKLIRFNHPNHWGKCFQCGKQMIQGGDHDDESGDHLIVSNFHCDGCGSDALFYWS